MLLMRPPGVYRPQGDTKLLLQALRTVDLPTGARVLDMGTGTGAIALAAALRGAAKVTAVDVSWRAVLAARANARLLGRRIRVLRGDLFAPVAGERFDVILANPPYVPSPEVRPTGRGRAWDAGAKGRLLLDRICERAADMLSPGGTLLMVHSDLCDEHLTLDQLREAGLRAEVVLRRAEPFGPVMRGRAGWLERQSLIRPGQQEEGLVVIRADRI